tara:strand:+ start:1490 stop:2302 length:813 start_codon:yes stop_codon:yes gene_type:complete
MATIDLGKIKQVFRGTYNNATAYVPDDLVVFTDGQITSTYICTTASTGNNPSSGGTAHANWAFIAKGVADPIPSQSGNSGKVLKTNGSALSWGSGFEGSHYLAYANQYQHQVTITVNGSGLSNGTDDGQRDCIVVNNGLYHTVTPGHADDIIVVSCSYNVYSNWGATGTYWGMGFQHSTATNFSANRNTFYLMGQHCHGNGGAGGDEYRNTNTFQQFDVSDIGMSVGTTYYVRHIAQVHTPNNNVAFGQSNGTQTRSRHTCMLQHYKKQT